MKEETLVGSMAVGGASPITPDISPRFHRDSLVPILQIVWASTTRLGVGRCVQRNYRRGGRRYSRMVLVARYSPAGNIRNRGNRLYDANVLPIGLLSLHPFL